MDKHKRNPLLRSRGGEPVFGKTAPLPQNRRGNNHAIDERDALLELCPLPLFTLGPDGFFKRLNPAWETITGWPRPELHARFYPELIHPDDFPDFRSRLARLRTNQDISRLKARFRCRNGHYLPLEWSIRRGESSDLYGFVRDASEQMRPVSGPRAAETSLNDPVSPADDSHSAIDHSALEGLVSRHEFEARLQKMLDSLRETPKTHAILYLNLERFHAVEAEHGTAAGTELLRQLVTELQVHTRQRDTLARLADDDFGLILENCNDDQALHIANDILVFLQSFRFTCQDRRFQFEVSVGVTPVNRQSRSASHALDDANTACFIARRSEPKRVTVFHEETQDPIDEVSHQVR